MSDIIILVMLTTLIIVKAIIMLLVNIKSLSDVRESLESFSKSLEKDLIEIEEQF